MKTEAKYSARRHRVALKKAVRAEVENALGGTWSEILELYTPHWSILVEDASGENFVELVLKDNTVCWGFGHYKKKLENLVFEFRGAPWENSFKISRWPAEEGLEMGVSRLNKTREERAERKREKRVNRSKDL